jgi:DNA-binding CsgD family transcriptional regulator
MREVESAGPLSLERLQVFRAAFLADPRPGLILEFGRLVLANEAAKRLLGSSPDTGPFLRELQEGVARATVDQRLCLRLGTHRFLLDVHPAKSRAGHGTLICFLILQTATVPALRKLTDRELGALTLLTKGSTNAEIAKRLGISVETVRKHVANALKKTGAKTRAGLVAWALAR